MKAYLVYLYTFVAAPLHWGISSLQKFLWPQPADQITVSVFVNFYSKFKWNWWETSHDFDCRLSIFDCMLIADSLIERSILPYFTVESPIEPIWFRKTYPYIWHPFKGIITTLTIYMMLAVSAERFRAICYPLSKRHVC